jgi:uncharacterized integral membrane protein
MVKKIDYYQDFLKSLEARSEALKAKKQKKLAITFIILLVYLLILGLFFAQNKNFTFLSFFDNPQDKKIIELESKIETMNVKLATLSDTVSSKDNPSFNYLNSKISKIESQNSYLYDTILSSPDSAITPKILREEQENLTGKFNDMKDQVSRTNTLLSGIFITLLLAIITYIVNQVWGSFVSRKNSIKE